MSKKKMSIWDRNFNLNVVCEKYSGQSVLETQVNAVEDFESSVIDGVKGKVEKYILKKNGKELGKDSIDNIFKYVMPKSIYVPQVKGGKVLAVMCHYKFDPEHGMAIVFENNKLKEIGEEDIVL